MPRDHAPERLRLRAERRVAGVILEADEHPPVVGLGEEIADEADLAGARRDVHDPEARDRLAHLWHVLAPEELVAAADREHRRAAGDRALELIAVLALQVGADDVLAEILAATEEVHVGPVGVPRLAGGERAGLDVDAAPLRALGQGQHVPAIAVDRHEVRIEVADAQVHRAQSSQNCPT